MVLAEAASLFLCHGQSGAFSCRTGPCDKHPLMLAWIEMGAERLDLEHPVSH